MDIHPPLLFSLFFIWYVTWHFALLDMLLCILYPPKHTNNYGSCLFGNRSSSWWTSKPSVWDMELVGIQRFLPYKSEVFSFIMLLHNGDKCVLQTHLCSSESFYGFALTIFIPFLCLLSTVILGNTFSGRNTHKCECSVKTHFKLIITTTYFTK